MEYGSFYIGTNIKYIFAAAKHTDVECLNHLHPNLEIIIVTDGILNMAVSGKEYSIKKGYALFVPAYEPHLFKSPQHNECTVLMFTKDAVAYFSDFLINKTPTSHMLKLSEECFSSTQSLLKKEISGDDIFIARAILAPIVYEIHEKLDFTDSKSDYGDNLYSAIMYMNQHFTEDITLESVAKAVGVHPVTLSKSFSKKAGVSFNSHLNCLRCSYAAGIIKNKDLSIADIAYRSGFGSIRSFNRTFAKFYGQTPSSYRNTDPCS